MVLFALTLPRHVGYCALSPKGLDDVQRRSDCSVWLFFRGGCRCAEPERSGGQNRGVREDGEGPGVEMAARPPALPNEAARRGQSVTLRARGHRADERGENEADRLAAGQGRARRLRGAAGCSRRRLRSPPQTADPANRPSRAPKRRRSRRTHVRPSRC